MHPYENLPLFGTGLVLAFWLIAVHSWMLLKPAAAQSFLKQFPRNPFLGQILLGIGLCWFWLLIAPPGMGKLSALSMELGEFNNVKPFLGIAVPVAIFLVSYSVRDFLAVRALGVVGLMAASPLLESAFLRDPASRLLIPIYAYALLTASLFWVGMPYLFRDAVTWITADQKRWKVASTAGLAYGVATLVCAFAFWRGY
ncbi:hypothetical protein OVA24_00050 [Luteolibacter sp. SL250]|uniref:hypothetical protein n=1 Tax=Luteolibacter sp. SL250 TaxID=2995170 RepID=UPI00226FEB4F|nr:hypothetical protein [Luteolibacter sp. SL250]WAC19768.1 hypothetical protein OVA24_00050 [Luteolibacter sp. SL250]